jgi:hypothetical protein
VTSDQEVFAKGLAAYQKVVAANYLARRQAYQVLDEVLLNEANGGFVFAHLACGSAPFSAAALAGPGVTRYIGVDMSKPAPDVAKEMLAPLSCPIELRRA